MKLLSLVSANCLALGVKPRLRNDLDDAIYVSEKSVKGGRNFTLVEQ